MEQWLEGLLQQYSSLLCSGEKENTRITGTELREFQLHEAFLERAKGRSMFNVGSSRRRRCKYIGSAVQRNNYKYSSISQMHISLAPKQINLKQNTLRATHQAQSSPSRILSTRGVSVEMATEVEMVNVEMEDGNGAFNC